jgi:hypothetical protein
MRWRQKVMWSPSDIDSLKRERDNLSIDQLTIYLSKSRTAITNKLKELDGKKVVSKAKKNKRSYIGKRPDLGVFCRSSWEANILRYFNHIGWKWLYEPRVFVFDQERRGAISYLPDIYLPEYDTWVEVKGLLDSRARGAIRKFKKYYPDEYSKLKAITGSPKTKASQWFNQQKIDILFYYNDINRDYKNIIENWE